MKKQPEKFLQERMKKYKDYYESMVMFDELYGDIQLVELPELFSMFHDQLNKLFQHMNERAKMTHKHYTAEASRELLYIIKQLDECVKYLKNTSFEFELLAYRDEIKICKSFLQPSNGSPIPDDFEQIEIIEFEPIFRLKTVTGVGNIQETNYYHMEKIGAGSYAEVYKYYDKHYNRNFVIKRAKDDLNDKEYERFRREYLEMSKLNSPFVVEVYNYNEEKREYTMEYLDETVYDYIDKNKSLESKTELIKKIINAFKYLHSKELLHRDISPMNILLKKYDNGYIAKVTDFGLVKVKESELTSLSSERKGFLNDPKLDLYGGFQSYNIFHETYAFTRLIYFILTGEVNIKKHENEMLNEFIKKGISDEHKERYQNMNELESAFKNIKW